MRSHAIALCVLAFPIQLAAQSLNVDFGAAASKPGNSYAAKGLPGVWNAVGALPDYVRIPLVERNGFTSGVELYMAGGDLILDQDDPATSGEDAALIDDMLIGDNNPVDVCVWFANVPAGDYEVILYGMTPSDAAHQNRLRVDFAQPGPTMCGGAWAGFHQDGVSFVRFLVHTENGYVGLHSGLYGGVIQSGLNGIQLIPNPPTDTQSEFGDRPFMQVAPNPARGEQTIQFTMGTDPSASLGIFDAAGRLVRHLPVPAASGTRRLLWDGLDASGRPVPAAVYFVRLRSGLSGAQASTTARVVRR